MHRVLDNEIWKALPETSKGVKKALDSRERSAETWLDSLFPSSRVWHTEVLCSFFFSNQFSKVDESPQLIADRRVLVPESQGECIAATGKPWWGRNWPEEGVVTDFQVRSS